MSFVQLIDCRTTRYTEMQALDTDWESATAGKRTLRRQVVTRDRQDPDRYGVFCFFDSYAAAMENSNLAETTAGAEAYAALMDGPPTFADLDVLEDHTLDEAGAAKPGFIQVIDVRTSKIEEVAALDREYESSISDRTTVRRSLVTRDRNDPGRFLILVFFDSYAAAMENSNLPETAALAGKMGALLEGPPAFHDLDVLDDRTF